MSKHFHTLRNGQVMYTKRPVGDLTWKLAHAVDRPNRRYWQEFAFEVLLPFSLFFIPVSLMGLLSIVNTMDWPTWVLWISCVPLVLTLLWMTLLWVLGAVNTKVWTESMSSSLTATIMDRLDPSLWGVAHRVELHGEDAVDMLNSPNKMYVEEMLSVIDNTEVNDEVREMFHRTLSVMAQRERSARALTSETVSQDLEAIAEAHRQQVL